MGKPMEKHKKCDIKVPLNIGCVPFLNVSKCQIDVSRCLQFLDAKTRLKNTVLQLGIAIIRATLDELQHESQDHEPQFLPGFTSLDDS